jgi:hypothetical protein
VVICRTILLCGRSPETKGERTVFPSHGEKHGGEHLRRNER